jgi:hypothetical protein
MSPAQQNKLTVLVKRFLDVIWFLFLIVAVIWPVTVMVIGLSIPSDPEQRHTDVNVFLNFHVNSEVSTELATSSDKGGELILSGRGDLKLSNTRSRLSWYLSGVISEVLAFIFLYGLLAMRKLFASLAEGSTFTEENAERIRKVGYVFIGWHIVSPVLQYFGSRTILNDIAFSAPGIQLYPGFEINIGGVFAGFAIIVLSGVLREAASIHREQSLTI